MTDDPHGSSLDATRKRLGAGVDFIGVEYAYPPLAGLVTFLIGTTEGEVLETPPPLTTHVFSTEAELLAWVRERPDVRAYCGAQRRLW